MHEPVLVTPSLDRLDAYRAALETGWSPRTTRPKAAEEELRAALDDPAGFVASLDDPEARGPDIVTTDGSVLKRLPSFRRWIWVDGFCGSIELRWQLGTNTLPATCSGHIGYAVVPWRRREGLATAALGAILPEARRVGLAYVELTTEPGNVASQRVIKNNGGRMLERCDKQKVHAAGSELLFRIEL